MNRHQQIRAHALAALLLQCWGAGAFAQEAPADGATPAVTYVVTIDGEEFEVVGGVSTKVTTRGDAKHDLTVRLKPIQTHATDRLVFDYGSAWSITDDGARVYRTVYLYHPYGVSMSITQHEPIADADEQKDVHGMLVHDMLRSVRRGNNRDVEVTEPKPCGNDHGAGFYADVRYIDQDGDAGVERLIVMTSSATSFSINQTFYAEDEAVVTELAKPTMGSIRQKPGAPPAKESPGT